MKIATWNVNSIRARLSHVCDWLQSKQPDVLLLQELKCQTEAFPYEAIEDAGYQVAAFGQKTYNGVAILAKGGIEDVSCGNLYFEDSQARVIEAIVDGQYRVISVYVPNGEAVGSEKYTYKLAFMEGFAKLLEDRLRFDEKLIIGGDFNVAPMDLDVYNPQTWKGRVLCSTPERLALRSLINLGLTDVLRAKNPQVEGLYTWWDYRSGGYAQNHGLRIDHLLLSAKAMESVLEVGVDSQTRGLERPSDHAPVWVSLG
ncbi:MAG: exodeoxyribonuclease III [Candidatus Paracaedibacteraceae bacterium]|nr:exodeoxyribonuclease III [Candidatus Paracaedibacteraceae bacterium]